MKQDCVNAGTVAKLCDEIKKLEIERDALAAHVERLRDLALSCGTGRADEFEAVIESTPQQSLAEHDAEVARKAYYSGYMCGGQRGYSSRDSVIPFAEKRANEYAQRIKEST